MIKYIAKRNQVWNGQSLAVTVWSEKVLEDRLKGESWLDMRKRTEPERIKADEDAKLNAVVIAALLNMRDFK